jgi:peptidoglycan/xylan/chitin deacetylase (PgdA/CDA1 family)
MDRLRRIARHAAPKALILLYHRVKAKAFDPQLLSVTPDHFAEHMQIIRQQYHPLRLESLRKRQAFNLWPPKSVLITFDDGYADNFHQARAILEAADLPSTVFVTSSMVGTRRKYWWDTLEQIFLVVAQLPPHLEIEINHQKYRFEFEEIGAQTVAGSWNVLNGTRPTTRQKAYLRFMQDFHNLDVETREHAISELAGWAGLEAEDAAEENRAVTADELRALPKNGLIDIGAHTANHPSLSALSQEAQRREILGSKMDLENILDRPVPTFAYPYGERRDYTPDTSRLVREAGFVCACANFVGQVTAFNDPYQLPRCIVRDWDGDTFTRQLKDWFGG